MDMRVRFLLMVALAGAVSACGTSSSVPPSSAELSSPGSVPSWGRALWEPQAFKERTALPSCGKVEASHGQAPSGSAGCLAAAVEGQDGAELAVSYLTPEGDPIVLYTRAVPGDPVEVFEDHTRDDLGRQTWTRSECAGFDVATSRATGCKVMDTWPSWPS
jgi:hypothetical protein